MNYEELKEEVKQIADIASSVPESFRDKCFELLLAELLNPGSKSEKDNAGDRKQDDLLDKTEHKALIDEGATTIPMKAQVRVLMRKTGVTREELEKVLLVEGEELHFIREPRDVAVAVGQIEWALLLALRNAILNDSLTTDPEAVRSVCQEKGFYDKANFAAIFKRPNNAAYFRGTLESQGTAQPLTPEGQDALGRLIKRLAGQSD